MAKRKMSETEQPVDVDAQICTRIQSAFEQISPKDALIWLTTAFLIASEGVECSLVPKRLLEPFMDDLERIHLNELITHDIDDGEHYLLLGDHVTSALSPRYVLRQLPRLLAQLDDLTEQKKSSRSSCDSGQPCDNLAGGWGGGGLSTTPIVHKDLKDKNIYSSVATLDNNSATLESISATLEKIVSKLDTLSAQQCDKKCCKNDAKCCKNDAKCCTNDATDNATDNATDRINPNDLVNAKYFAEILNCSTATIRSKTKRNEPGFPQPHTQVNKKNMWLRSDVERYRLLLERANKATTSKPECPKFRTCIHFRMTEEEGKNYVIPWYKAHNLPTSLIKHVVQAIDTWLGSDTPTANNARRRTTSHYLRLYDPGFIAKGQELARLSGDNSNVSTTNPVRDNNRYGPVEQDRSQMPDRRIVKHTPQSEEQKQKIADIVNSLASK